MGGTGFLGNGNNGNPGLTGGSGTFGITGGPGGPGAAAIGGYGIDILGGGTVIIEVTDANLNLVGTNTFLATGHYANGSAFSTTIHMAIGSNLKINTVPEPASLLALGLGGVALVRRRRR